VEGKFDSYILGAMDERINGVGANKSDFLSAEISFKWLIFLAFIWVLKFI